VVGGRGGDAGGDIGGRRLVAQLELADVGLHLIVDLAAVHLDLSRLRLVEDGLVRLVLIVVRLVRHVVGIVRLRHHHHKLLSVIGRLGRHALINQRLEDFLNTVFERISSRLSVDDCLLARSRVHHTRVVTRVEIGVDHRKLVLQDPAVHVESASRRRLQRLGQLEEQDVALIGRRISLRCLRPRDDQSNAATTAMPPRTYTRLRL